MMTTPRYAPPTPPIRRTDPGLRGFLRAARSNVLGLWPDQAYEQDVYATRFLGRTTLLLNAPDAIRRVLVDNPGNYRRSPASIRILRPLTGDGLLLSEGAAWRLQRRTIAPALGPRMLPLLARHVVAVVDETVAALRSVAGGPVDLLAAMQGMALEIAGRSMFSVETSGAAPALRAMVQEYGADLARAHLADLLLPVALPTFRDLRRRWFRRRWMAVMSGLIRDRLGQPPPAAPRDLFDLLRAARDPETGAGFGAQALRDQTATMILAGHETTAVTLFWALSLLAAAPEEQALLAAEVRGLDLTAAVAAGTIPELPRTRAVVAETLRLYPPAFTMARAAIGPDDACCISIPSGTLILIAPWVLHRHRRFWGEPAVFDPDRFAPGAPPPPRFAYLPFGAGPRMCVGAQFALTEAALGLAALVRAFEITRADDRPVLPVAIVTTQPDHAPGFRLRARTDG
ncbi:MAG: cytochrome P450 [Rhodospirillales bacterium]|nr:cytochrome P450 [Rhodospirillales bacterium]